MVFLLVVVIRLSIVEPQERRILVDTRDAPCGLTARVVSRDRVADGLERRTAVTDAELIPLRVVVLIVAFDDKIAAGMDSLSLCN